LAQADRPAKTVLGKYRWKTQVLAKAEKPQKICKQKGHKNLANHKKQFCTVLGKGSNATKNRRGGGITFQSSGSTV
jgi:hypothetical protein